MNSISYLILLASSLFVIGHALKPLPIRQTTVAPSENLRLSCRSGQAISSLIWRDHGQGKLDLSINCTNVTDDCNEFCERRERCTSKLGYVRGLDPFFDSGKGYYRTGYLCCNASINQEPKCQIFKALNGTDQETAQNHGRSYFRSAKNEGKKMMLERCEIPQKVTSQCKLAKTRKTIDSGYVDPEYLKLLGLLGLIGLVAIPRRTLAPPAPTPAPPPPGPLCPPGMPAGCCGTQSGGVCEVDCVQLYIRDYAGPCEEVLGLGPNPPGSREVCCYDPNTNGTPGKR